MNILLVLALITVGSISAHVVARWVKGNVAMVLYGVGTTMIFAAMYVSFFLDELHSSGMSSPVLVVNANLAGFTTQPAYMALSDLDDEGNAVWITLNNERIRSLFRWPHLMVGGIFVVWSTYKVYMQYPGSVWWYVLLTAASAYLSYSLRAAKRYPFPGPSSETADL